MRKNHIKIPKGNIKCCVLSKEANQMINNLIQRRKKNKLNHDNSKSNCLPKLNRSFTKTNTSNINYKFNYSEIIKKKKLIPNNQK